MDIFQKFEKHRNPEVARGMTAYMRDQFVHLGIKRPERDLLQKDFIKEKQQAPGIDDLFIHECWARPEREFQHLAMDYLRAVQRKLVPAHLDLLVFMITTKSWWDTVDLIAVNLVGPLASRNPSLVSERLILWPEDQNMWLRRSGLLFQLKYKENTDIEFLSRAIELNTGSSEFFINKAIGWVLRQYSKTDAEWVREFIASHDLAPLSVREGSKYL